MGHTTPTAPRLRRPEGAGVERQTKLPPTPTPVRLPLWAFRANRTKSAPLAVGKSGATILPSWSGIGPRSRDRGCRGLTPYGGALCGSRPGPVLPCAQVHYNHADGLLRPLVTLLPRCVGLGLQAHTLSLLPPCAAVRAEISFSWVFISTPVDNGLHARLYSVSHQRVLMRGHPMPAARPPLPASLGAGREGQPAP